MGKPFIAGSPKRINDASIDRGHQALGCGIRYWRAPRTVLPDFDQGQVVTNMPKEIINPPELFPSQQYGFSQIVTASGGKSVYLSGQVAWDASQKIVGPGDLSVQTRQALENVKVAMAAAGGRLTDVVSLRIYIVEEVLDESHHISEALRHYFPQAQAPAATWIGVRALANEDFLIEIEAIGVIDS